MNKRLEMLQLSEMIVNPVPNYHDVVYNEHGLTNTIKIVQ